MTRPPDDPVDGIPASIAAIMAAIRHEVAARPAAAVSAAETPPPFATEADARPPAASPIASDSAPVAVDPESLALDAGTSADDAGAVAAADPRPAVPALPPHLDDEARTLLAPLLKAWLDAHLPEIVETAVHAEIRRLTGMA